MSMPVYLFARRFLFGTIKSKVETFYGGNMHHKVTAYSTFYVTISVSKELFTCEGAKNCIHFTASEFPFYADWCTNEGVFYEGALRWLSSNLILFFRMFYYLLAICSARWAKCESAYRSSVPSTILHPFSFSTSLLPFWNFSAIRKKRRITQTFSSGTYSRRSRKISEEN